MKSRSCFLDPFECYPLLLASSRWKEGGVSLRVLPSRYLHVTLGASPFPTHRLLAGEKKSCFAGDFPIPK